MMSLMGERMKPENECKGCTVDQDECIILKYYSSQNCPCIECLVKPICIEGCDEWLNNDYNASVESIRISKKNKIK